MKTLIILVVFIGLSVINADPIIELEPAVEPIIPVNSGNSSCSSDSELPGCDCGDWDTDYCPNWRGRKLPLKCIGEYRATDCFGRSYTKFFFIPRYTTATWYDAHAIAKSWGTELATLKTLTEATTLSNTLNLRSNLLPNVVYYIGGYSNTPKISTEWYWTDDDTRANYALPWKVGEPNFANNNEHCLTLDPLSAYAKMNDDFCHKQFAFVAQKVIYDIDNCLGCGCKY